MTAPPLSGRAPAELWEAVVQAALVGTERAPAALAAVEAAAPEPLASALAAARARRNGSGSADPEGADPEGALLDAAAVLGLYVRAGQLPPAAPPAVAVPAPAPLPDLPEVPYAAARALARIQIEGLPEHLPEWLRLAAARGWRVTALAIPAMLNAGLRSDELRALVPAVVGARGRWLAAQNPEWSYAADGVAAAAAAASDPAADRALWETGTSEQRITLLTRLRRDDPARAREMLAASWEQEPPKEKAKFIEALEVGLGDGDESFLEAALDDRRKEVRRAAADLLARLPASALVARMRERVQPLLAYQPGKLMRRAKLAVELPGEFDKAMERDGVNPKPPSGTGERAWWMVQMLATVPPSHWTRSWSATAEELIEAAARIDEWDDLLISAWSRAAIRFRDEAWAEALLAVRPTGKGGRKARQDVLTTTGTTTAELIALLPPQRREAVVARAMREHAGRDARDARMFVPEMLDGCRHAWSEGFTRDVLAYARPLVVGSDSMTAWGLANALPQYALRMPPSLADEAAAGWPTTDAKERAHWPQLVERMIALLQFRREMAEAFK